MAQVKSSRAPWRFAAAPSAGFVGQLVVGLAAILIGVLILMGVR